MQCWRRRGEIAEKMTTILVDTKEPPEVWATIKKEFPDARQVALGDNCGDLLAQLNNGVMIVERKEAPDDLCASVADGRLFRQAEHIPRLARFPFLVLDGQLRYSDNGLVISLRPRVGWTETGWRKVAVEAALLKCEMLGMIVVRDFGSDYADTVKRLVALCEHADASHVQRGRARPLNPFDDGTQAKIDFLASLPGVGVERAANLIEARKEDTLIELLQWIVNTSGLEQERVALWGQTTRERVREFLGLRASQRLEIAARTEWKEVV